MWGLFSVIWKSQHQSRHRETKVFRKRWRQRIDVASSTITQETLKHQQMDFWRRCFMMCPKPGEIRSWKHLKSLWISKKNLHCRRNTRKLGSNGQESTWSWIWATLDCTDSWLGLQRRQESSYVSTTTWRRRPNDLRWDNW